MRTAPSKSTILIGFFLSTKLISELFYQTCTSTSDRFEKWIYFVCLPEKHPPTPPACVHLRHVQERPCEIMWQHSVKTNVNKYQRHVENRNVFAHRQTASMIALTVSASNLRAALLFLRLFLIVLLKRAIWQLGWQKL